MQHELAEENPIKCKAEFGPSCFHAVTKFTALDMK